jgi:hypothetical protein
MTVLTEQYGEVTIEIDHDHDCFSRIQDVVNDEPVMIVRSQRLNNEVIVNQMKQKFDFYELLALAKDGLEEYLEEAVYSVDVNKQNKSVTINHSSWMKPRRFKNMENAAKAVFKHDYDLDLKDLKFVELNSQYETLWCFWLQSEFDEWSGTKNSKPSIETFNYYLKGDIYHYKILDKDGKELEAMGGYIGSVDDVLAEAKSQANYWNKDIQQQEQAEEMMFARPDMYN